MNPGGEVLADRRGLGVVQVDAFAPDSVTALFLVGRVQVRAVVLGCGGVLFPGIAGVIPEEVRPGEAHREQYGLGVTAGVAMQEYISALLADAQ